MLFIALMAGHLVVVHGRTETLWHLWRHSYYYASLSYSSLIALILLWYIEWVSRCLHKKYRGTGNYMRWIMQQLKYGVLLTVLIEIVMATALFAWKGYWIWETAFFRKLFGPIVMFIIMVNLGFLSYFFQDDQQMKRLIRYRWLAPRSLTGTGDDSESEEKDPLILYVSDKQCWSIGKKGTHWMWAQSMELSEKQLCPHTYFRGHRCWMIHRKAIVELVALKRNHLEVKTNLECPIRLMVSRRRIPAFMRWLERELPDSPTG